MIRSANRPRWLPLLLLTLPALVGFVWPGTVEWLTGRGVKQYRAMEFDRAAESFERALEHDSDNATLQFNRATALHQEGRLDAAAEAFLAAAEHADGELAVDAWYGLGNTLYRAGEFAGAAEAYREALRIAPADGEAKFNLELAQQRQQEQQQQQQQRPDEEQDRDENGEQDPDPGEQEPSDEERSPDPQETQPDEERPAAPEEIDEEALSAEQARRLLRALASEDAELQKTIRRQQERYQPRAGEKDW